MNLWFGWLSADSHDALTSNGYHSMVSGVIRIAILDILIFKHEICLLFSAVFGLYPSVQLHRCTSINNNDDNNNNVCKMVAVTRCQSQSNSRC